MLSSMTCCSGFVTMKLLCLAQVSYFSSATRKGLRACKHWLLVQIAVRNLVFSGRMHIILTPLLNSLPVVGAVQVNPGLLCLPCVMQAVRVSA